LMDLKNIIYALLTSSMIIISFLLYKYRIGFPRSVYIIDAVLTLFFVGGIRIAIRLLLSNNVSSFVTFRRMIPSAKKLMIIGAGGAGEKVLREIDDNSRLKYNPIGFLDDKKDKQGKAIHGVPVLGTIDQLADFAEDFDEVLIAIPSASSAQMRRIVEACENTGKRFRTMPPLGELIGGKISLKAIREVTIEDLLGRGEVSLDQEKIQQYLKNKRILVTGAGGSIGSELVRQIGRFNPQAMALVDFSEFNLYQIANDMNHRFGFLPIYSHLVDIRDHKVVDRTLLNFKPQVVFHAAAYKHVPMQELHPWEAVFNNILGTRNLVEASLRANVERFVLVSTDKAVRPTNVMGATKRLAEMFIGSKNGEARCRFIAVRFGNVIRSSGSGIPLFQEQIPRGGPVRI